MAPRPVMPIVTAPGFFLASATSSGVEFSFMAEDTTSTGELIAALPTGAKSFSGS